MHPYPLRKPPANAAPQSPVSQRRQRQIHRRHRAGRRRRRPVQHGAPSPPTSITTATPTCWSPATATSTLYRNKGDGTFEDVTAKAGLKVPGWSIGAAWLDYDRDGCVDLFVGRYVKFDPEYRAYYAADNYPGPLDYEPQTEPAVSQQLQRHVHRCQREVRHRALQEPRHGRHRGRFRRRRLPRYLRRQRQDREFPVPQRKGRNVQGDRRAAGRGFRTERREHFRHGAGVSRISTTTAAWICG